MTYSEGVSLVLCIQHTMRMRCIILLSVAFLAVRYFPTSSHKRHNFHKNAVKQKMRVLIFSTAFV
jgi:hypothetical protein